MQYDGDTIAQWAGPSQWRALRADLARFKAHGYSGLGSEGFWALAVYRLQRHLHLHPSPVMLPVSVAAKVVKKLLTLVTHINLHHTASIGPGMLIPHVGPIQVFPGVTIGADCAIHHVCTIGAGAQPGAAVLGDHVMMGCHSCVLGPVTIGDRVNIGAGAVVVSDIPADHTAVGVPAKAVPRRDGGPHA
jgi:serine O-acetyltransferase